MTPDYVHVRHSISKGLELIYVAVTFTDSTTEYYKCPHCRSALPGKAVDAGCTLRTVLSLLLVLRSSPADPAIALIRISIRSL